MAEDGPAQPGPAPQPFVRARRPQHQDARREALVAAAWEQLQARRAVDLTLGHVAVAVGMSKSSVLRYFSSRDALLLELLARQWREWVEEAAGRLPPPGATVPQVAAVLAAQAAGRPVMCDLIGIAPAVLEHSADPADVVRFKTAVIGAAQELARALEQALPGLDERQARLGAESTWVLIAGLWPLSQARADVSQALAGAGLDGAVVDFESALAALSAAVLSAPPA